VRPVAIALALIAAIAAAWSGWSWYAAEHDDSLRYAATRDEVLRTGEQAIQNLNTLDHRSLDRSLRTWQDSSTSDLYRDIVQGRAAFERQVAEAKTISSARILEGAVTELDTRAGTARVIVAAEITVTPPKGVPAIKRSRLIGELTRTAAGWKLSALGQAPVANG
jgi:Mce-associated membrane protein